MNVSKPFSILMLSGLLGCGSFFANTDSLYSRIAVGEQMIKNGDLERGLQTLGAIAEDGYRDKNVLLRLSDIYIDAGAIILAERMVQKAQDLGASDQDITIRKARILLLSGRPTEALSMIDAYVERSNALGSGDIPIILSKAIALDTVGNHASAQNIYNYILSIDESNLPAMSNLSLSLILSDQSAKAVPYLTDLIRSYPSNGTIRHNLATALYLSGDDVRAYKLTIADMSQEQAQKNFMAIQEYIDATKGN